MTKLLSLIIILVAFLSCDHTKSSRKKLESKPIVIEEPNLFDVEFNPISKHYLDATRPRISRFYQERINVNGFSGSFLVAKNGKVIFEKTNGYFNKWKFDKLNNDDPIHVASIGKVATAILILRYCDKDLIDLDADVRIYLSNFPYQGITVRMLLNHRSGLPYYGYFADDGKIWDRTKKLSNKDVLNLLIKHKFRLYFPPNKKFFYCNTNYAILALIAEKVGKMPFPKLMKKELFEPLEMKNSFIADAKTDFSKVCQSYYSNNSWHHYNFLDGVYGDKNMYTTARDFLKLDCATYSSAFLSDSIKNEMYKGYSFEKKGIVNYGLGIRMYLRKDEKPFYFHTGWWHGNTGCYLNLRSDTLFVFAVSNRFSKSVYSVRNLTPDFGNFPSNLNFDDLSIK